jgi:hypothetical protein
MSTADRTTARKNAYFQTAHVVFEDDRYSAIVADPVKGWTWVRLAHAADRAWPGRASLPRWADQPTLDALVAADLIELSANDEYSIPGLDAVRSRASESASKAGKSSAEQAVRDDRGHFLPRSQPTPVGPTQPTPVGPNTQRPLELESNGGPTTETKTKTKTKTETNVGPSAPNRGIENTQPSVSARVDGSIGSDDGARQTDPSNEGSEPIRRIETAPPSGEGIDYLAYGEALLDGPISPAEFMARKKVAS